MPKTPGNNSKPNSGAGGGSRNRDLEVFSRAVNLFNAGKFGEAKQLFDQLAGTADRGVADAARTRALICERRAQSSE